MIFSYLEQKVAIVKFTILQQKFLILAHKAAIIWHSQLDVISNQNHAVFNV